MFGKLRAVAKAVVEVPAGLIGVPLAVDAIRAAERRWPKQTAQVLEYLEELVGPYGDKVLEWWFKE